MKYKTLLATALTALSFGLLAAPVQAEPKLSVQSIIVNPVPTKLKARVWVDRDPSGNQTPSYSIGEPIRLYVNVNENAYVYLFNVNADGTTDQIFPNAYTGRQLYLRAGTTRSFPTRGDQFQYNVGGPSGLNRVLVIGSRRPLNLSELSSFSSGQPFAQVKPQNPEQLAQALSIVVNPISQPIPQTDWISDTAFYNVY